MERLFELAAILGQQNHFDEILRVVAQKAAALLNAEMALIAMINPQTRQTVKTVMREGSDLEHKAFHVVQTHVSGWILTHRRPFATADLKTEACFSKSLFNGIRVKTVLGVPLCVEGIIIGTLILLNVKPAKSSNGEETFRNGEQEEKLKYLQKLATIAAPFLRNVHKIQQYFAAPMPEAALLSKYESLGLLGRSKKFVELLQAIEAAARCDVRVLLEGQSGTGKELIARAVHGLSRRSAHPFVAIDCGAIPSNLIESELFGHVRGAFTGATADRIGLLEEADQGTLFMDEIASLPLDMQAKFMRVLQEGEFRPVGSNRLRSVDVRFIAASSSALRKLVDGQKFREDLFYRLHVYPIQVPSLGERREDVPLLASHFLKKFAAEQGKCEMLFHEELLDFLEQRRWAGNIRELENLVERLVALAPPASTVLDRAVLPADLRKELKKAASSPEAEPVIKPLSDSLTEYEESLIRQALLANNWNVAKTARVLRVAEQTLRYKMAKTGIIRGN